MNLRDESFRSMCNKVLSNLDYHKEIWEGYKLMKDAVTIVRAKVKKTYTYEEIQAKIAKGWQEQKSEVGSVIKTDTLIIYIFVRSYAISVNDTELKNKYKTAPYKLNRMADTTLLATALGTVEIMDKLKDKLMQVGLTNEIYDKYVADTTQFETLVNKPEAMIAEQEMATQEIDKLIKELREILSDKIDTFMMRYMTTEPDFYASYIFARIIFDNPSGHFSLVGLIIDEETKKALPGVKIEAKFKAGADLANTVKKSGAKGNYIFKKLADGMWDITFSYAGYDTLTLSVAIHDGQTTRLDVALRKTE